MFCIYCTVLCSCIVSVTYLLDVQVLGIQSLFAVYDRIQPFGPCRRLLFPPSSRNSPNIAQSGQGSVSIIMIARGSDYNPIFFSLRLSLLASCHGGQTIMHIQTSISSRTSTQRRKMPRDLLPRIYRPFVQLFPVQFACQTSGVELDDLFRGKLLFQNL